MARTKFQQGAERGHYHEALGVNADRTGEQTTRLLGPFSIAHNTAGLEGGDAGAPLVDIDAGVVIVMAWLVTTAPWDDISQPLAIRLAPLDDLENAVGMTEYTTASLSLPPSPVAIVPSFTVPSGVTVASKLSAIIMAGGTATSGAADIFALIAEPA